MIDDTIGSLCNYVEEVDITKDVDVVLKANFTQIKLIYIIVYNVTM